MERSDTVEIQATLAGDATAYKRLVEQYQQEIARRMWRFTRDRRQLEELVQDVFVEAYMSLKSYRGTAPFANWLNRIATRVGYRFWKRRRRTTNQAVALQDWDAFVARDEGIVESHEAAEFLHSLLAQLPPRDRLVLTLLYLEELSVAEAAERSGWSQSMVKVQAHRARKKLKAILEKSGKTAIVE